LQRDFHIPENFAEQMQEPQKFYSQLTELRTTNPLKFRQIYLSYQIAKYDDSILTAKSQVEKEYPIMPHIKLWIIKLI